MRIVIFCHSIQSDWNHGNAHFLRGVATGLIARDHDVRIFEPRDAWSLQNLLAERGRQPLDLFRQAYPKLDVTSYDPQNLDLDDVLEGAALVMVHEWNTAELVRRVGRHRARTRNYRLFFHDTHHRALTDRGSMAQYDLRDYDGVLAFGRAIRDLYLREGWAKRAWTWHEAADTRVFYPRRNEGFDGDLVWIGNWGDGERAQELREYLLEPVRALRLKACVYGVRYPDSARAELAEAGIEYGGWLPNFQAPAVFARYRATVHVPRRPYAAALPGIPTIRMFEALACGIPLVSAPWSDVESLFTPGRDFLTARDGGEMTRQLETLLGGRDLARAISRHGLETVQARHTCAHRVDELLEIYRNLEVNECQTDCASLSLVPA